MTIEEKINSIIEQKEQQEAKRNFKNFYLIASFVVMFGGLFATYRLVGLPQPFNLLAASSETPTDIQVNQVTTNGFTIAWKTEAETTGYISYGKSVENKDKIAFDNRSSGADKKSYKNTRHEITVNSAEPNQVYFYEIVANGREYSASEGSIFTPIKTLVETNQLNDTTSTSPQFKSGFSDLVR